MKRFFYLFCFSFMIILINATVIAAELPNSFSGVSQVGSTVVDECGLKKDDGTSNCYAMPLKTAVINSQNVAVICTQYYKAVPAGQTCTKSDWNNDIRYGVAAIIDAAKSNINSSNLTTEYFVAEMAINKFIYDKTNGGADIEVLGLSSTKQSLFNSYISKAVQANYEKDSIVSVSLSSITLDFKLEQNKYVSNSIAVNNVSSYDVKLDEKLDTNKVKVEKSVSDNSFKITVDKDYITSTTTINAIVNVKSNETISLASNYTCGANYQSLTPVLLESTPKTGSREITGTITPEPERAKLIIHKFDDNNQYLEGVKIKVTGPNNYENEFITNTTSINLINLEFGKYVIEEIGTPEGYVTAPKQTIMLDKDNLEESVTLINNKTKVKISKLDATEKKELPGATLEIQDENGQIVKYCTDEKGNTNIECKWVSTDKPYEIEGLPTGTYYLIETIAPKGYVLNKEKIKFEIADTAIVKTVTMENSIEVEVPNTLSSKSALLLTVAMFDVALGIGILTFVKKSRKGN